MHCDYDDDDCMSIEKKSENKCGRRWKKNIRKQHKINVESKIKEKQQTSE